MTKELSKNFDFAEAEDRLYQWWEEQGYFKPDPDAEESFVISIPPPNVTGALHTGHAMFVSLEDVMIRQARMKGKSALWVPGTDHAGIATQLQVEKLLVSEGTSRKEVGREEFLRRTWQWKEEKGGRIQQQLRRMGASVDWDRERFTMDEGLSEAVQEAFVRLYEDGLIYKGTRLINWSPGLQTAVSDLEVENKTIDGKMYYFRYPVEGESFIPVATTRPETILGDTAVCVHPEDERYKEFIGKKAYVPMLDREIPIIADEYVDREFGTGALKITPGHDFNDYEIGERHDLPIINIMNKDATLNENAGQYAGMERFEARKKLWDDMTEAGLTDEVKPHQMTVPVSQRGGEVVEPLISEQWFVKIQPLADKAIAAVRNGDIKIVPEHFEKVYFHWLENIEDWCISRQLWWGHRIPAWVHQETGEIYASRDGNPPDDSGKWVQEEDVLDTWFSSGLWPFSTLGWPNATEDFAKFYPTAVLETGYDILFFWVARMIMMGLWFTDEVPFHTVYLHGLVRDGQGRKMSKTIGNVIDPIEVVDEHGADALRFTLITGSSPGNDMNLSVDRIDYGRRFGNKIWQIARLIQSNLDGEEPKGKPDVDKLDLPSQWILSRLHKLIARVDRLFDNYQYGEAGRQILTFMWDELADYYLEIAKNALYGDDDAAKSTTRHVLVYTLDTCMRLLHPYMPYITEEIWQSMPHEGEALIIAEWPESDAAYINDEAEDNFAILQELVIGIRNTRNEYDVEPGKRIDILAGTGAIQSLLTDQAYIFSRLCNVETVKPLANNNEAPDDAAVIIAGDATVYMPMADMIDFSAEKERLTGELEETEKMLAKTEKLLSNENFVNRANPDVVQKERDKLAELQATKTSIEERLAEVEKML